MRKSWNEYFLDIADVVATRSTCPRAHVGCVVVRDNRILVTGYNGSLPGCPHCDEVGCLVLHNHCKRTVHAEANAIYQSSRHGIPLVGTTLYCTLAPCSECEKIIASVGIKHVVVKGEIG